MDDWLPVPTPTGRSGLRRLLLVGTGVFVATLIVYILTMSPTVNSFDSGEFIAGAYVMGIIHSPGYPLYLLLGYLISHLTSGDVAYSVNLLSATFGAATATIVFFSSYLLSGRYWSAVLAAFLLAFSLLFWSQSLIAEVYTLNTLLIGCISLAVIQFYRRPATNTLITLGFVFGLSLTHHPSAAILIPGLLIILLAKRAALRQMSIRELSSAVLAFLLPLSLYLYLPLRFRADPAINYVGDYFAADLGTIEGFLWMVSGRMFSSELLGRTPLSAWAEIVSIVKRMWLDFYGIGFLLVIVGLGHLRREKPLFRFYLVSIITTLLFFAFYDVVDSQVMVLPIYVLSAPLAALGLAFMVNSFSPKQDEWLTRPWPAVIVVSVAGLVMLAVNWSVVSRRDDRMAYDVGIRILESVEENSVILTQWTVATPLEYLQIVEGHRPDVSIIDRGLLGLGIRDHLKRSGAFDESAYQSAVSGELIQIVEQNLGQFRVYLTEQDPVMISLFCVQPIHDDVLYEITGTLPSCLNDVPD